MGTASDKVEDVVEATHIDVGVEEVRESLYVEHFNERIADGLHAWDVDSPSQPNDILLNRHNLNISDLAASDLNNEK